MDFLPYEERVGLTLRKLFSDRGYVFTRAGRFEDYGLYLKNKNFLATDSIITFMDVNSKLKSLKPDVTLSLIKSLPDDPGTRRICYADDVYRLSREQGEYKVLHQVGVELISDGGERESDAEIIDLAMKSLSAISPRHKLTVSYLGKPSYDWKSQLSLSENLQIDETLTNDLDYYNGLIFRGYIEGHSAAALSGGRYDLLCGKMGKRCGAVGFAVTLNNFRDTPIVQNDKLSVALPKGRLSAQVIQKMGYASDFLEKDRKLIVEDETTRFFLVKPSDVAVYVERGAADLGVVGSDILVEYEPDVLEIRDLGLGKCAMCAAALSDFVDNKTTLKIATKFVNTARKYYGGREIELIHLNGSIEIAPLLGLSDIIVDIVETGSTLRANDLRVIETLSPISARLIVNRASYQFKRSAIDTISRCFE